MTGVNLTPDLTEKNTGHSLLFPTDIHVIKINVVPSSL